MEHHLAKYLLTVRLELLQHCLNRTLVLEGHSMTKIIEPPLRFTKCNLSLLQLVTAMLSRVARSIGISDSFFDGFLRLIGIACGKLRVGKLD